MDSFNKIISFVLGLVVVVVFLAVITGKLNLRGRVPVLTKSTTPTTLPTVTPTPISTLKILPTPREKTQSYNRYQKSPSTIPATGSPTIIVPFLFSLSGLGFFLRGRKPRDF